MGIYLGLRPRMKTEKMSDVIKELTRDVKKGKNWTNFESSFDSDYCSY